MKNRKSLTKCAAIIFPLKALELDTKKFKFSN